MSEIYCPKCYAKIQVEVSQDEVTCQKCDCEIEFDWECTDDFDMLMFPVAVKIKDD